MESHEERAPEAPSHDRSPWEPPTVTLVGTIALLVRAGSAGGKGANSFDGDLSQFQTCNPAVDPLCPT